MTSAHLTSNSMLCYNTFLCPRRLFSSPISSWLCSPQPRKATKLSLFQLPGVYKEPGMGQDHQSHLCCCLDNTSPRLAFTSTSALLLDVPFPDLKSMFLCRLACVHQEDCSSFTRKSTSPLKIVLAKCTFWLSLRSHFTYQDRACQVHPLTFTQKSLHLSRTCLQVHSLTFTQKSLHLSRMCLQMHFWPSLTSHFAAVFIPFGMACHCGMGLFCGTVILLLRAWCCHQVPHILLLRMPTVGWVLLSSWRSSSSATAYWCHTSCWTGRPDGLRSTLSYLFVAQVLCLNKQVLAIGCHLY